MGRVLPGLCGAACPLARDTGSCPPAPFPHPCAEGELPLLLQPTQRGISFGVPPPPTLCRCRRACSPHSRQARSDSSSAKGAGTLPSPRPAPALGRPQLDQAIRLPGVSDGAASPDPAGPPGPVSLVRPGCPRGASQSPAGTWPCRCAAVLLARGTRILTHTHQFPAVPRDAPNLTRPRANVRVSHGNHISFVLGFVSAACTLVDDWMVFFCPWPPHVR